VAGRQRIKVDNLDIDTEHYSLLKDGVSVHLTRTEWMLLNMLLAHDGQVVSHRQVLQLVWGAEYGDENDYVHTYISRLRRKLDDDGTYIITEPGIGYRIAFSVGSSVPTQSAPSETDKPPPEDFDFDSIAPSQGHSSEKLSSRTATVNPLPQDVYGTYVGREKEQMEIKRLIGEGARLISIYGRGGVGKTALACKVLDDLSQTGEFGGMVYLSATTTGISPGRIISDFKKLLPELASIDMTASGKRALVERITALMDALTGGTYILLLDNLEDLQKPGTHELTDEELLTFFQVVLTQQSGLRIIITSRYPLTLPRSAKLAERLVPLDEGLSEGDAVQLLLNCDPDRLTDLHQTDAGRLRHIARKTRGFPRALQAVAGLLMEDQLLTVDELIADESLFSDEIERVFVENAIERLGEDAVRVMEVIALFRVPVGQDGIEAVLSPFVDDTSTIRPILNRLIRAFFVFYNRQTRQFSLHPIDRAYCYARIPAGDHNAQNIDTTYIRKSLHHLAADYYRSLHHQISDYVSVDELLPQLNEFEHRVDAGQYDTAADLLLSFDPLLALWGEYTRLDDLYTRLLDNVTDEVLRYNVLLHLGEAKRATGKVHAAIQYYEDVLAYNIAEYIQGKTLNNLGWTHYDLGQFDAAIDYWQAAYDIYAHEGDSQGMGNVQGGMGWVSYLKGDYEQAIAYFQRALDLFRQLEDRYGEGINLGDLGAVYTALGDYEQAVDYLKQSLGIAEALGATREKSHKGGYLATAHLLAGDLDQALEAILAALGQYVPSNQYMVAAIHGVILMQLGREAEASHAFEDAVRYADALLHYTSGLYHARYARGLANAGLSLLQRTDTALAINDYHRATTICSTSGVLTSNRQLLEALMLADEEGYLAAVKDMLDIVE